MTHHHPAPDNHPLADLPVTTRIDLVLATLSAMETQKPGGWSQTELADLCGCSITAIHLRQQQALRKLRNKAPHLIHELNSTINHSPRLRQRL